jgi:hypothetical protein
MVTWWAGSRLHLLTTFRYDGHLRVHVPLCATEVEYKADVCHVRVRTARWTTRERTSVSAHLAQVNASLNHYFRIKMRTNIRIRNEYKDYTTLPAVLLAQQAPVGPVRPKTLAITAGCVYLPSYYLARLSDLIPGYPAGQIAANNDKALTLTPTPFNGSTLNGVSNANSLAVGSLATSTNFAKALALHKQTKTIKPAYHAPWKLVRVISGHLGWVRSIAVEPGNEWFATGAGDRVIKVSRGTLGLTETDRVIDLEPCFRGTKTVPYWTYLDCPGTGHLCKTSLPLFCGRRQDGQVLGPGIK